MVDYKFIGDRIRSIRLKKKLTQAQLAEAVGVGVTHISHIETGNTVPSLQTLIEIINSLDCSADEILCLEVKNARTDYYAWLADLLEDCSEPEVKLITDTVKSLKASMRRLKISFGEE